MVQRLVTLCAAGMTLDIDAAQRQVNSVKSGPGSDEGVPCWSRSKVECLRATRWEEK